MNPNDYAKGSNSITSEFKAKTYNGRVVQVINCGLQHATFWDNGQNKKLYWLPKEEQTSTKKQGFKENDNPVTNVIFKITVEFPTVRAKDNKGTDVGPSWLTKEYRPNSKEMKALLDNFEIKTIDELAGQAVTVNVAFTSGNKPKMTTILAVAEGTTVADLSKPSVVFDFYEPDLAVFNAFPKFIQDTMKGAIDYPGSKLEAMLEDAPAKEEKPKHGSNFDDFDEDDQPF